MKKIIEKFWKVSAFYLILFVGMISLNARFEELNENMVHEPAILADNIIG